MKLKPLKPLSAKDEKIRAGMNSNNLQIGQLVIDDFRGTYSYIRGFKTPWIWILEPLEQEDNFENLYYTVHFTELSPVNGKRLFENWEEGKKIMERAQRIARLANIEIV